MNAKTLLPLTAAAVFAVCTGAMLATAAHHAEDNDAARVTAEIATAQQVVNLPTVAVTPDAADLAYYQTYGQAKVVNLAAVTVFPEAADLAYYQTYAKAKVVEFAEVNVYPEAADLAYYLGNEAARAAQQVASR